MESIISLFFKVIGTLIKKKRKFSSDIRKFRWTVAKSYMREGFLIEVEMRKY
jgi:hypothetical protein